MSIFRRIVCAFRPLDTSAADEAIALAHRSQRDVAVRARALRMDISCGDPTAAIERLAGNVMAGAGHLLRASFAGTASAQVPLDMQMLVARARRSDDT